MAAQKTLTSITTIEKYYFLLVNGIYCYHLIKKKKKTYKTNVLNHQFSILLQCKTWFFEASTSLANSHLECAINWHYFCVSTAQRQDRSKRLHCFWALRPVNFYKWRKNVKQALEKNCFTDDQTLIYPYLGEI